MPLDPAPLISEPHVSEPQTPSLPLPRLPGHQSLLETFFTWSQLALLAWALLAGSIRFNLETPSLPRGIYLLYGGAWKRGDVVLTCFPSGVVRLGRARGYHPPGRCADGSAEILKKVAALPGDRVRVDRAGIHVNHTLLPGTRPLEHDSRGRRMPRRSPAPSITRPHQLWLYSDHIETSWDSRYFGPVDASRVRARARLALPLPLP